VNKLSASHALFRTNLNYVMNKVVFLGLSIFLLTWLAPSSPAQTSSADSAAVNRAILNQADTILLRQKLEEAKGAVAHGDLPGAAKLYQDAYGLVEEIGPSGNITQETAQTINGLVAVRLELARQAQKNGDLLSANNQAEAALKVDPKNPSAVAFKKQNDALVASLRGKIPDQATMERAAQAQNEQTNAQTLVRDGKLLYEMGKFEEAQVKLEQALRLDNDNQAAFYYLNLVKQAYYAREEHKRIVGAQDKMVQIAKEWTPKTGIGLPMPNPYANTNIVHTGAGREVIYTKLDRIHLDAVAWADGLPLSEVIRFLTEQSRLRDPDKKGVNFNFNPNVEQAAAGGPGAAGLPTPQINQTTGLPETPAGGAGETIDPSTINVKLTLNDVSLQDALNAIVIMADRPIKYSVEDWGVVFSTKPTGPEPPQLEMRIFKVDPNTFYQGLQSVSTFTFGSANNSSSGSSGGSSGGSSSSNSGGGNSGGGSNGSGSQTGAVVPVVNIAGGGGNNGGNGGGGGGGRGGGGGGGGGGGLLGGGGGGGGAGGAGGGGGGGALAGSGVAFLTTPGYTEGISQAAQNFFRAIGVDLTAAGRSIAFNDRLGLLFVKATPGELDTIERTIQALNQVAPQVHIKSRFIEVGQSDNTALGFDWYLGNFTTFGGRVVNSGGSSPSLNVPVSANNPLGAFPGNSAANVIPPSANDQLITAGLRNSGPALATVTGILTDPNFRVVIHALEQRSGTETLAEPEVVTTSGRQTQMRATQIQYIVTGYNFQQAVGGTTTGTTTTGP
jgi:hypothetical protein